MRHDIQIALRLLRRDRGFTALAALALGLGIGVNSTFFSLVNAAVLRGLPIDTAGEVMFLSLRDARNIPRGLTLAQYEELRRGSRVLTGAGAYSAAPVTIGEDDSPLERVPGASISGSALRTLGVTPLLGRELSEGDDRPGAPAVALIGHRLWQSRFDARPSVVGQTVAINGTRTTIVGVMPEGFQFPGNVDVWTAMTSVATPAATPSGARVVSVFGRLAPGRTSEQAQAELEAFRTQWARQAPAPLEGLRASAVPINQQFFGRVTDSVWLAFITAGALVFLIACANVANLLLMRAAARDREVAVRISLGATRGRIVRQLLTESAVLAASGTMVGLGFAMAGLRLLQSLVPGEVAGLFDFSFDSRVLTVVAGVSCASVFLFGLAPALHLVHRPAGEALRDGGRGSAAVTRRRWATAFLAAEFALTLVLLANVAVSVRVVRAADDVQVSIDPAPILTMWIALPNQPYDTPETRNAFHRRFVESVTALPSVSSASLTSVLPESGGPMREVAVAGRDRSSGDPAAARAVAVLASERYFETLGLPLIAGRPFNGVDGTAGQEAAIVNERFAVMFLTDTDPLGALIRVAGADGDASSGSWLRVVGVVPSVRQSSQDGIQPDPVVYLPVASAPPPAVAVVVRAGGDPAALIPSIRAALRQLDPQLPLDRALTLTEALRQAQWNGRIARLLLNGIATIALLLALVGLYAVTAHSVRLRRKELGIRLALGATRQAVGALVLQRALGQLGIGLAVGVGATYAFDRFFITSAFRLVDPLVLAPTVAAILAVAITACLVPASRAVRVDPAAALRDD